MSTCENRTQKAPRTAKLAVGDESLSVPCGNTPKEKFSNINMEAFLFRSCYQTFKNRYSFENLVRIHGFCQLVREPGPASTNAATAFAAAPKP